MGPDLVLVTAERLDRVSDREIEGVPDLVVEVSSPTTYRHDRVHKRRWYEAAGVPEYWFVDLDQSQVEVYRLRGRRYPPPEVLEQGGVIRSHLPGLEVFVDEAVSPGDSQDV